MLIRITGNEEEKAETFYTMITNGSSYSSEEDVFQISEILYEFMIKKHKNIEVISK